MILDHSTGLAATLDMSAEAFFNPKPISRRRQAIITLALARS